MRTILIALAAACGLGACTPAAPEKSEAAAPVDAALAAIQSAHVHACAADSVRADARTSGFGEHSGVTIEELASVPMAGDPARVVRLQRVTVAPGGIIGWHPHGDEQGMALLVSGEVTEARNNCTDTIAFTPGDITLEDANTVHAFRNDGAAPAVFLVWGGRAAP